VAGFDVTAFDDNVLAPLHAACTALYVELMFREETRLNSGMMKSSGSETRKEHQMTRPRLVCILTIVLYVSSMVFARQVRPQGALTGAPALEDVLAWLPADTESLIVARGPFTLPAPRNESQIDKEQEKNRNRSVSAREIREYLRLLPLSLFYISPSGPARRLAGKKISLAVEGSRHFRAPQSLGEMPYEGCAIVVLEEDLGSAATGMMTDLAKVAGRVESIAGQQVPVFQEKMEDDTWTVFVANPSPRILVVASNELYLRELLQRMKGATGPRALPDDLPEWKQVDKNAEFWGLRHFDRSQAAEDPSSPYGGKKAANDPDEKAIGVAINVDFAHRRGSIVRLSDNLDLLKQSESQLRAIIEPEQGVRLKITNRLRSPGVLETTSELDLHSALAYFELIAEGALGHAIYM